MRLYLIKLAEEDGVADNFTEEDEIFYLEAEEIADKAAGGDGAVLSGAGGARRIFYLEAEEIADNFTEGDEFPEERAGGARETEVRAGGLPEALRIGL